METRNIFEKGCLIMLKRSCWTGHVKLPIEQINRTVDPDFIKAAKYLVDREVLKPINLILSEASSYVYSKTIPFDISGFTFIPKDMITIVDIKLKEYEDSLKAEVEIFAQNYEVFISDAEKRLGPSLFNRAEYPRDIRKHFDISWKFIILDMPGQAGLLSPEVYEREKQKYIKAIDEFQSNATGFLRTSFATMIDHTVERLSGEKKVFRDTLIGNIREFIEDFKALNITDDAAMEALTERCKFILDGISPQDLRDDDGLREHVARKMGDVQTALDDMMVDRPSRKLRRVEDVAA